MTVRHASPSDAAEWLRMRTALWPAEDVADDVDAYFRGDESPLLPVVVFVAMRSHGGLCGFIEVGLRAYAEGCQSTPVPFLEGWYVDADARGGGIGAALVHAAEEWSRAHGYREIASDAELANTIGIDAHRALGYEETERLVCFRRAL